MFVLIKKIFHLRKRIDVNLKLQQREIQRLNSVMQIIQNLQNSQRQKEVKFFCIGSNKTGTTSLDSYMRIMGFSSAPEFECYKYVSYSGSSGLEVETDLLFKEVCSKYTFFQDLPFSYGDLYKEIDNKFPNANFILTIREANEWFESCLRWVEILHCGDVYSKIWGIDFVSSNKCEIVKKYNLRNLEIINYFKKNNRLYVHNIDSVNIDELCKFLKVQRLECEYPHYNINNIDQWA